MSIIEGSWSDDVSRLIDRIEIRLEQYKLHAAGLAAQSREREGADAIVKRLEDRLLGLRCYQEKHRN